jgi:excisionase family DNA binding protein
MGVLELSRYLGLSPNTVRKLIDSGRLPGRRTAGGHRRVTEGQARAFRETTGAAREPVAPWLAAAEAVLWAAAGALGPGTPEGGAFAAAAEELRGRLVVLRAGDLARDALDAEGRPVEPGPSIDGQLRMMAEREHAEGLSVEHPRPAREAGEKPEEE